MFLAQKLVPNRGKCQTVMTYTVFSPLNAALQLTRPSYKRRILEWKK